MAHRIGPEGGAWPLIRAALARERHLQVMPGRVERDLEALVDLLRRTPGGVRTARAEVADLTARTLAVRAAVTRSVLQAGHGEVPPVDAARNKVLGTTLMQDIARSAVRLGGRAALKRGAAGERPGGRKRRGEGRR